MFTSERFNDIKWNEVRNRHKTAWSIIEKRFGVLSKYRKEVPGDTGSILQGIAANCIDVCSDLLFSSKHRVHDSDDGSDLSGWYYEVGRIGSHINMRISQDELYDRFRSALKEHLIVTFSYWYYYCNKPGKSTVTDAAVALYYQSSHGSYDFRKDEGYNKSRRAKWNRMKDDIISSVSEYHRLSDRLGLTNRWILNKDSLLREPNWLPLMVLSEQWKYSPFSVEKIKENGEHGIKDDSGFRWDFQNSARYIHQGKTQIIQHITELFTNNDYLPLLLREYIPSPVFDTAFNQTIKVKLKSDDAKSRITNEIKVPTDYNPVKGIAGGDIDGLNQHQRNLLYEEYQRKTSQQFYCYPNDHILIIPWERTATVQPNCTLDSRLKETDDAGENSPVIPYKVQRVLNCYLIERIFHLRAIERLERFHHSWNTSVYKFDNENGFENYSLPLTLHACLLHETFINLAYGFMMETNGSNAWLKEYIAYWNAVALPVLEEVFLWAVFDQIQQDQIEQSIEEAFDEYCDYFSFDIRYACLDHKLDRFADKKSRRGHSDLENRTITTSIVQFGYYSAYALFQTDRERKYSTECWEDENEREA